MSGITLRATAHGEAAPALHAAIVAAKGGDPLAPVTVVVPSNHLGVAARRLLASGRLGPVTDAGTGLAAVSFLTVYRLAELLGAAVLAGQGRRPVSTPVVAAAVRGVLRTDAGLFAGVAEHPATEAALVASYRELRDVDEAALDRIAACGRRAGEVVRVHRATRAALAAGWYDEEDLMAATAARVAADPTAVADLGAVVVHLPEVLSRHAATVLRSLAEHAPTTVVAALTGCADADAEVGASLARLGLEVPAARPARPATPADTALITTSDADDEVRAAVRQVLDAVRRGTPLDRIAVLHPGTGAYGRLVHERLAAAGVRANGTSPVPLAARVAGRTLLGLLDLAERGWPRPELFAWLTAGPLLVDGRRAPASTWERIAREAGVVGGIASWDERLLRHADDHQQRAEALATEDGVAPWRIERHQATADRARRLRRFVLDLDRSVAAAQAAPRPWSEHATWARDHLHSLLGAPAARGRWPEVERRAAERVEVALDRLAALDHVEGPVPLEVVARTLGVELENDLGRVGRFGDGVLVGPISLGIGLDLDLVVVLGLAEGTLPTAPRDDSLLPDHERRAAGGALGLRRDHLGRQHRHLLASLAGAERRVLCMPRGDLRRSSERVPSRWLLDVASELAQARTWAPELAAARAPWVTHVPSFDGGLRQLATPATAQEHRLRTLLARQTGRHDHRALRELDDPALRAGAALVEGRSSSRLTRYDGHIGPGLVPSPADPSARPASATGLERWARCPFAYFVHDVLGVRELPSPEDELSITPLDRGSLVHEVLDRFLREVLARPEADRPRGAQRWSPADRARLQSLAAEVCDDHEARGLTGRPLFWRRDRGRILVDLDRTLDLDERVRAEHGGHHLASELSFGSADGAPAAEITLPDGRRVRFRGQADRIDLTADGGLLVVDYKTGGTSAYSGLGEDDPDQGGAHLQLVVYGQAARAHLGRPDAPVRAEYWFTSTKGGFGRIGYPITEAVEHQVQHSIGLIVAGIESGLFPSHPAESDGTPFNPCPACDPDFLGLGDLRRAWADKQADPLLATYLHLIAPAEPDPAAEAVDA